MTPEELVGVRVRLARQKAGLTQARLGQELGRYLGSPWSNIVVSLTELGKRNVTPSEMVALAAVLKRPVAWFFTPLDVEAAVDLPGGPLAPEDHRALGRPEGEQGTMLVEFAGELVQIGSMAVAMLDRIHRVAEEMVRAGISVPPALLDQEHIGQPLADVRVELLGDEVGDAAIRRPPIGRLEGGPELVVIPAPPGTTVEELAAALKRSVEQGKTATTRKRTSRKPTGKKGGRK